MEKIVLNIQNKKIKLNLADHFSNLVKINQSFQEGCFENYKKLGLTYVEVPVIVGITGACENIDTLFKIQNRLSLPLFFTQTGQLYLEQALQSFSGVYTVVHSGRDEEVEDERHLKQFRLTEEEFDCTLVKMKRENYDEDKMYEALLDHIESTIKSGIKKVLDDHEKLLEKVYRRNIKKLKKVIQKPFLRITYEKVIEILRKKGWRKIKFGDDLKSKEEAFIVNCLNSRDEEIPVFIMKYPKEIKFFNMKVWRKDPRVVLSADLIFPYSGEGVGSAVREHDFEKLNERLLSSTMYKLHLERGGDYEDFKWYLNIIKEKRTNPHAGYGIGNERVLQYIFGEKDIRNVSIFSLLNKETEDWSEKRYGKAALFSVLPKQILLSIGKIENKKLLLPFIKKLSQNGKYVLYATKGTHEFLKKHKIRTVLVYKVSEKQKKKGLGIDELLKKRVFDLIINIPSREKRDQSEISDGKFIRQKAIEKSIPLITDCEVGGLVIENLLNKNKSI